MHRRHDAMDGRHDDPRCSRRVIAGLGAALLALWLGGGPAGAQAPPVEAVALGRVTLPQAVRADGVPLSPGTYELRLTGEAVPSVVGQTDGAARWVAFCHEDTVAGRALATRIPAPAIGAVANGSPPREGETRVERLRGGDYLRIWLHRDGVHYLLHLPLGQ